MAVALTCPGTLATDINGYPTCSTNWEYIVVNEYMTEEEFSDLVPVLMLMFVTAFGIRMIKGMFLERPSRY